MVLFLFGINHAALGLRSPSFWLPACSGLLLFVLHITIERRSHKPIFPPRLYLRGFFAAAVINGIGWNVAQAVVQLQTSNFWQLVQGYSTSAVAFAQLPFLICFGVAGIYAGRWMGPGRRTLSLMAGGSLALVLGLALFAIVQVQTPYWQLLPALMLAGLGLAFVAVPQSALFVQEAPEDCFGSVLAFRTTSGQLGFAFGLAASGTMISGFGFHDLHSRMQAAGLGLEHLPQLDEQIRLFLRNSPISLEGSASQQLLTLLREAYTQGLAGTMVVVAVLTGLLFAISLLLLIIGREQQLLHQEGS
jgi:MFS family permease